MIYLYVGIGGILGSLIRYGVSILMGHFYSIDFPFGTMIVNIFGSFLLAWMTTSWFRKKGFHPQLATAIGTGLIGSFTTLSTFSLDFVSFIQMGNYGAAAFYSLFSGGLGFLMALAGYNIGTREKEKGN